MNAPLVQNHSGRRRRVPWQYGRSALALVLLLAFTYALAAPAGSRLATGFLWRSGRRAVSQAGGRGLLSWRFLINLARWGVISGGLLPAPPLWFEFLAKVIALGLAGEAMSVVIERDRRATRRA